MQAGEQRKLAQRKGEGYVDMWTEERREREKTLPESHGFCFGDQPFLNLL